MEHQQTLSTIIKMVDTLVSSYHVIDKESLAVEIWTRCWKEGRNPTWIEVSHRVIDKIRSHTTRKNYELDCQKKKFVEPEIDHVDNRDYVEFILEHLSERHREFLTLRYYEGMSSTEIAEVKGISDRRVRQILEAAVDYARKEIVAHEYPRNQVL